MTLEHTKTKTGKPAVIATMGEDEFRELSESYTGLCLGCGELADSCEPDARKYKCDACGAMQVYGLEEALLMGRVTID
jgi:hypothetical protein